MAPTPVPGSDFLHLDPSSAPPKGLTAWLVAAVRSAITDGRLAPGARLPATRTLAADLGISRGAVVEAYQRLTDEGLTDARTGVGTLVAALGPRLAATPRGAPLRSSPPLGSPLRSLVNSPLTSPLRLPLTRWAAAADIDLSPGVPDLAGFPRAAWLRAERTVLGRLDAADLGYGDPQGSPRLRDQLATWLGRTRGIRVGPDAIIVVAGVAQSLALVAHVLAARGVTAIAVEDPGARGARDELDYWGVETVAVPVDGDGLRVDELERTGVTAALLTPAHQFPTGVVLAPRRRRELLAWAAAGNLVLEDDYDAEHRYDRAPVPALHASDPDHVVHTGSTSKTLAPGLRLGWLIAPPTLRGDLIEAKHASDLGSPALPQLVLAQLLRSGDYDRHLRLVRGRQRARRDAMLEAVGRLLPQARIAGVAAGLHLLVTLPEPAEDTELAERIRAAGVLVHPLSWHRRRPGPPGLVLGYAAHPPDRLRDAVGRIADVLSRAPRRDVETPGLASTPG